MTKAHPAFQYGMRLAAHRNEGLVCPMPRHQNLLMGLLVRVKVAMVQFLRLIPVPIEQNKPMLQYDRTFYTSTTAAFIGWLTGTPHSPLSNRKDDAPFSHFSIFI